MQKNFKFFTIIIAVFLVSTILLTGSMLGIGANNGEPKQYNLDEMADFIAENVSVNEEDAPTSQEALQKKFSAMSEIDKETNTITVITKEYLDKYWQTNADKEPICTLSVDEVFYIIQDSINMYFNGGYSKVVFPAFGTDLQSEDSVKLPCEKEKVFSGAVEDKWENVNTVYEIILHRVRLLSSPEAFYEYDKGYNKYSVYFPNYYAKTDEERDFRYDYFGGYLNGDWHWMNAPEYFLFGNRGIQRDITQDNYIYYCEQSSKDATYVYPTSEIVPMLPGRYALTEDENAEFYDVFIADKGEADEVYLHICDRRWEFTVKTPSGDDIDCELCDCKILKYCDYEQPRLHYRKLSDGEWQLIVDAFSKRLVCNGTF